MKGDRGRLLVIGLDGATFDKMGPWLERGYLPNISRLSESGVKGELTSTIQPVSPAAWSSMITGNNPGKTGVFGWEVRDRGMVEGKLFSSAAIKSETLWSILGRATKTVSVVNVPGTFPPVSVNGYLISDWLTPSKKQIYTYPPELGAELEGELGEVLLWDRVKYAPGKEKETLEDLVEQVRNRGEVMSYLLKKHPTDFTMVVFPETDRVQHRLWKYDDPAYPGYNEAMDKSSTDAILKVHQEIDSVIGELVQQVPDDTTVVLVSDHGAGPLYKLVFMNRWLMEEGLLRLKKNPSTLLKYLLARYNVLLRGYNLLLKLRLNNVFLKIPKSKRRRIVGSFFSSSDIDWSRTRAYSTGDIGQIYVNLKGREPEGIVSPGPEYDKLIDDLTERLRRLTDSETGEKIVTKIFRKEDIYRGDYLEMAPDLSFIMKDYGYITSQHLGFESKRLMESSEYTGGNTGCHRMNGIFIIKGPGLRTGCRIDGARIIDVAPTILYQMGLSIPNDMDGRVLEGAFERETLEGTPVKFQEMAEDGKGSASVQADYTSEEEEEIKDRLRNLGYLA